MCRRGVVPTTKQLIFGAWGLCSSPLGLGIKMEGCQGTSLNKQGTTWAGSCLVMRSCYVDATLLMGKSNRWTIKFAQRLIACQAAQLHLVQLFEALLQQDWHDPNAIWFPNMGHPQNHPFIDGMWSFHEINQPAGYPHILIARSHEAHGGEAFRKPPRAWFADSCGWTLWTGAPRGKFENSLIVQLLVSYQQPSSKMHSLSLGQASSFV